MTTRYNEEGYIITDFTEEQKENLLKIEVSDWFIRDNEIKQIKETLKLDEATSSEELRAIRNSAVMFLHDYVRNELGRRYMNLLSGTTAVIDNEMQKRFNTL